MTAEYIPMAISSMATGRIKKAIDELGGFPWGEIAKIIDETVNAARTLERSRIMSGVRELLGPIQGSD